MNEILFWEEQREGGGEGDVMVSPLTVTIENPRYILSESSGNSALDTQDNLSERTEDYRCSQPSLWGTPEAFSRARKI